jgi:FKBP-type peptidyl-prolyl cis-trans isomerase
MKRCVIALCLLIAALTVHAKAIRDEVNYTGENARTSYAFGMSVGNDLRQAGLELDYNAFMEGLKTAMEGRQTIMDRDEALEIVQDAFEIALRMQSESLRLREEIFLAENAARPGVISTDSGLQYEELGEGNGPKPSADDVVLVHYEGTFIDGTVFDSSYERGGPEEIPLEMVIPGWAEGIQLMNTGSKYRLYIPSELAYGGHGAGQFIPPYATLIFTVELFDIVQEYGEDEP